MPVLSAIASRDATAGAATSRVQASRKVPLRTADRRTDSPWAETKNPDSLRQGTEAVGWKPKPEARRTQWNAAGAIPRSATQVQGQMTHMTLPEAVPRSVSA